MQNRCLICGKDTEGSIGAAGIKWPNICQSCKDQEDKALFERIKYEGKVFDKVIELCH